MNKCTPEIVCVCERDRALQSTIGRRGTLFDYWRVGGTRRQRWPTTTTTTADDDDTRTSKSVKCEIVPTAKSHIIIQGKKWRKPKRNAKKEKY